MNWKLKTKQMKGNEKKLKELINQRAEFLKQWKKTDQILDNFTKKRKENTCIIEITSEKLEINEYCSNPEITSNYFMKLYGNKWDSPREMEKHLDTYKLRDWTKKT